MNKDLYAVILAGGSGTRLWPLSRKYSPKQLLKLIKGQSLLDMTIKRSLDYVPSDNIIVISSADISSEVRTAIQSNIRKKISFIDEPVGKDTATAIGIGAAYIASKNPNGKMVVLPSDHLIEDDSAFKEAVELASKTVSNDMLITFGIKPSAPDTGFGYIKPGEKLDSDDSHTAHRVEKFYEKPNITRAKELVESGCLWNSGIFVFKASVLLDQINKYMPDLGKKLTKLTKNYTPENFVDVFKLDGGLSIDYGVLEKAKNVAVIPIDIQWKDLGNIIALEQLFDKDGKGNVFVGNSVDIGSKNSLIYANERLLATVGLENVAVIDTADVTLVCDKKHVQDVKKLVDMVRERGGEEHLIHKTVERPWGSYTVMNEAPGYKVKRVEVKPGETLSLQFHRRRSEHWVLVSGKAKIQKEDETIYLYPGESTYIPATMNHRLENPGPDDLVMIEVQIGEYLEEDDIERLKDIYDRQ